MRLIDDDAAIDALVSYFGFDIEDEYGSAVKEVLMKLPPAQPKIIRCKDCKFYTPLNCETKSGICNLLIHQNFGDDWYCAGAEKKKVITSD